MSSAGNEKYMSKYPFAWEDGVRDAHKNFTFNKIGIQAL